MMKPPASVKAATRSSSDMAASLSGWGGRRGVRVVVERRVAGHPERAVGRHVREFERHFPEHLAVCRGSARDVPLRGAREFGAVTVDGAAQSLDRRAQPAVLDGALEREREHLDVEGLGDEVVGAGADGRDCRLEVADDMGT